MLFNSIEFLIFFPVVTIGYFILHFRFRWAWLLAASCYFYMAFRPIYILILAFTIVVDYFAGLLIEHSVGRKRKLYLVLSLIANLGVLCIFKYYNFFIGSVNGQMGTDWSLLHILLPIGLSFHTFQAMSYTIEVYRGNQKAERHFGIYALYVMFYPQLVAGPIERPQNILPQFHIKHEFNYENARNGLLLMAWGMFKKVVIADRLALFVDQVYNNPLDYQGPSIAIASVFFAFQIYCDFSGYSDIAIGAAQVMGFRLMKNFDHPYAAKSVAEFWRRWHISLSTWFRDYLYFPLGGSRMSRSVTIRNTLIVFIVSGLWHGANWNYLIWGALHGFFIVFALTTLPFRQKISTSIGMARLPWLQNGLNALATFSLVTFAWIFFRADYADSSLLWKLLRNLGYGWDEIKHIGSLDYFMKYVCLGQKRREFILAILLILFLQSVLYYQSTVNLKQWLISRPYYLRWGYYVIFMLTLLYLGEFSNRSQFIYFQF